MAKAKQRGLEKLTAITLGGEIPCRDLKGMDKELYECVVQCLKARTGLGPQQGRVILLFEPKGNARKPKKR
jgi:hypothetical protein